MKLSEAGYRNIYFAKEKDKFDVLYGNGSIGKAGFSTQGGSRAQILTKLEEALRNDKIDIYSQRFVDELKTFVWTNNTAQASRGKNDDLIMSLAIGLWLYDVDVKRSKTSVDLNAAMLAGFAMNKSPEPTKDMSKFNQQVGIFSSRGISVSMEPDHPAVSGSLDFKWLL
jgi:hypothetical protein